MAVSVHQKYKRVNVEGGARDGRGAGHSSVRRLSARTTPRKQKGVRGPVELCETPVRRCEGPVRESQKVEKEMQSSGMPNVPAHVRSGFGCALVDSRPTKIVHGWKEECSKLRTNIRPGEGTRRLWA